MSKLVDSSIIVQPFLLQLLPGLLKVETSIGDPEAHSIIGQAIATLHQVSEVPEGDGTNLPPIKGTDNSQLMTSLMAI